MQNREALTQEDLKKVLDYDPDTGVFTWKIKTCSKVVAGREAGSLCRGYIDIRFQGTLYKAHRLAYLWMTGNYPPEHIDHINRVRYDNRWGNLRACTNSENSRNTPIKKSNTSGYIGVSWNKAMKKWESYLMLHYKKYRVGYFDCPLKASKARDELAKQLHGEFFRTQDQKVVEKET